LTVRIARDSMEGEARDDVDVHGIEIRRINEVTLEEDASLEAPFEVCARAAGTRELTAGGQLVVIHCELANRFGDRVAAFSFEIEVRAQAPGAETGLDSATEGAVTPAPDLDCVDNIPV
jgi:hypothetical protein